MDGDLQDPPEVIPSFVQLWRDGYDVVYAIRRRRKEGWLKRLGYFSFYRLLRAISDLDIPVDSGDFCLMDRKVVEALKRLPERKRFVRGLRTYVGFRQIGLAYERGGPRGRFPQIYVRGAAGARPRRAGQLQQLSPPPGHLPGPVDGRPRRDRDGLGAGRRPVSADRPARLGEHPRGRALHGLGPAHLPGDHRRVHPPDLPGVEAAPGLHRRAVAGPFPIRPQSRERPGRAPSPPFARPTM